ncbi:hypothetical protein ACTXT7_001219 [Hymenolepis weldensis]
MITSDDVADSNEYLWKLPLATETIHFELLISKGNRIFSQHVIKIASDSLLRNQVLCYALTYAARNKNLELTGAL